MLISARALFIANSGGATPVTIAAQEGHHRIIATLAKARASIDQQENDGWIALSIAAMKKHENVVRLLAHLGARLIMPNGDGFWQVVKDDETRNRMGHFWRRVIAAGGDEPTEESRRTRRRLMVQAKMHDPRDGGPDAEPL